MAIMFCCPKCNKFSSLKPKSLSTTDVYRAIELFKCSCGYNQGKKLTPKEKRDFWHKGAEKSGKEGAKKRWKK